MPPKLLSDDGAHVVIRPLAYCSEQDIARYAELRRFPLIPCDLCGSQPHLQRQAIKAMLSTWKKQYPGRIENIFRALANVSPSQLADRALFDFVNLGGGAAGGDVPDWLTPVVGCGPEDGPEEAPRHAPRLSRATAGATAAWTKEIRQDRWRRRRPNRPAGLRQRSGTSECADGAAPPRPIIGNGDH
jgi:hypothetical protein